ncbi:MAG TPA: hypothetical protein VFS20_10815 [Longimicrobium sp.]|nr:hypothetical protein [Longimicrobium sp.]
MNDPESRNTIRCPTCAGQRVVWRIARRPNSGARGTERVLFWTCKGCGAGWKEPLASVAEPEAGSGPERPATGELPRPGGPSSPPVPERER